MPTLHIVATPIGNLEDISLRALKVLTQVSLIAAEDTRTTQKLLRRYEIGTPLTSYNEHNHKVKAPQILKALENADVALVSEAGTPPLHDPGLQLVCAAIAQGARVSSIPGPSAVTTALAGSGLPANRFMFVGFLPSRQSQRRKLLEEISGQSCALVAFETPHRLTEALKDILDILGDRHISIGRELTKLHEEWFRGNVSESLVHFGQPRGEFTLVIQGAEEKQPYRKPREKQAKEILQELRSQGYRAQKAVAQVSQALDMPKRTVYRLWLSAPKSRPD
jgi:16S rRNA (cytidine1402-2'-O)-methyltransferase